MKYTYVCLAAILLAGCNTKEKEVVAPVVAEDATWIKLEVPFETPTGDAAYSITGDIDKTLIVATKTTVFTTTDKGKTWQRSKRFNGPVPCLLQRQDTVFAFHYSQGDSGYGERVAFEVNYLTTDYGKTWLYTWNLPHGEKYLDMVQPTGRVEAAGTTYYLKGNSAPIANSSSRLLLATDLVRATASGQTMVTLPGRHYLNNLHLDAQNRLYVAASGLMFDQSTGQAINPNENKQAVVYISRNPLP
jgi:uncharacterized membrane protein